MTEDWLDRILHVRRWAQGGKRAPHKPLLMLLALARLQATGSSRLAYVDAEAVLDDLLDEYGPSTSRTTTAYPFHRLQNDELWTVRTTAGPSPGDSPTQLRRLEATGQFVPELEAALRSDPRLLVLAARGLLDANFPESLHAELSAVLGLDLEGAEVALAKGRVALLRRRDPRFREAVLVAYEYRCAVCGYDGRVGREAVALDAAHVRWWAFEGPDDVDNAVCLCSLHHKLFDRGVLGITADGEIAVSRLFVGRGRVAEELVVALVGRPLSEPQRGLPTPAGEHVSWHAEQVFRRPARVA